MTASPSALPTGTRPEAIAPTTVPMKKGVTSEESAESALGEAPVAESPRAILWKANPEPRRTIPSAARLSGMNSVDMIEENADRERGPEHDQHEDQPDVVGLPDGADRPVDQRARSLAALAAAGDQRPEAGAEVGAAEHRVQRGADPEDAGDSVGGAHAGSSGGRRGAAGGARRARRARPPPRVPCPPAVRHRPQNEHGRDRPARVEERARPRT